MPTATTTRVWPGGGDPRRGPVWWGGRRGRQEPRRRRHPDGLGTAGRGSWRERCQAGGGEGSWDSDATSAMGTQRTCPPPAPRPPSSQPRPPGPAPGLSRLLGGPCEAAHTPHGKSVRPLRGQAICSLIYGLPERRLWRRKARPERGPGPQLYGCCLRFLPGQD